MAAQTRIALSEATLLEGSVRVVQTKQRPALERAHWRTSCRPGHATLKPRSQPMIYSSAEQWQNAPHKRVVLWHVWLGKPICPIFCATGAWFHYRSIIASELRRVIISPIASSAKLWTCLSARTFVSTRSIGLKHHLWNSAAIHLYGQTRGPMAAYRFKSIATPKQHRCSEIAALLDTPEFIDAPKKYISMIILSAIAAAQFAPPTHLTAMISAKIA